MAITKNNINTYKSNNSCGNTGVHKKPEILETKKKIIIHKSYNDVILYALNSIKPLGHTEFMYYKEKDNTISAILVLGNIPGEKPIIFTSISHIINLSDNNNEKVTLVIVDTMNDKIINDVVINWENYGAGDSSLIEDSSETYWEEFDDNSTGNIIDNNLSGSISSSTSFDIEYDDLTNIDIPGDNNSSNSSSNNIEDTDNSSKNIEDDGSDVIWDDFGSSNSFEIEEDDIMGCNFIFNNKNEINNISSDITNDSSADEEVEWIEF